jgi:hypothetical protein
VLPVHVYCRAVEVTSVVFACIVGSVSVVSSGSP